MAKLFHWLFLLSFNMNTFQIFSVDITKQQKPPLAIWVWACVGAWILSLCLHECYTWHRPDRSRAIPVTILNNFEPTLVKNSFKSSSINSSLLNQMTNEMWCTVARQTSRGFLVQPIINYGDTKKRNESWKRAKCVQWLLLFTRVTLLVFYETKI